MREAVEVSIEICREGVSLPFYANPGDAGMDVRAAVGLELQPRETALLPTGLKMAIPEGYEIQVRPRSGLSFKTPLRLANAPGTIDAGYRDEICVILQNTSESTPYRVEKGDRIAQLVIQKVPEIVFREVNSVRELGVDRGGGFGSTGVQ